LIAAYPGSEAQAKLQKNPMGILLLAGLWRKGVLMQRFSAAWKNLWGTSSVPTTTRQQREWCGSGSALAFRIIHATYQARPGFLDMQKRA